MIREATTADVDRMLELGEAMHRESRYAPLAWNADRVRAMIAALIGSQDGLAIVAERSGRIVGGFLGEISPFYFSDATVASDYAVFLDKSERGGITAARLIREFVEWADQRGATRIQIGVTTGITVDSTCRLFERLGFVETGRLFEMEGAGHG